EFGAVSVVSGNIRGETNTLSLHVELLYQDYNVVGAFAAASLLAGIALITIVVKSFVEWRQARQRAPLDELSDGDRKSTRLNSSHVKISYAVFCLKKKNKYISTTTQDT